MSQNGKGSRRRPTDRAKWDKNWARIKWESRPKPTATEQRRVNPPSTRD